MNERLAPIATPNGTMETFITHPQEGGPFAPVVIYMDMWGVREEFYDIARRIATVGYYVMVPDLYYRQGRIRIEFRNEKGQAISLDRLDEKTREKAMAPLGQLTDGMVVEDSRALLKFLDTDPAARAGPIGSVGYCMGGRHVLAVAGQIPERFRASASLHGTLLINDKPDSPHLLAHQFRGEMYCGFAETDSWAPPATIAGLAELLKNGPVNYRYEIHKGAVHGYALPDRDIHHKQGANRDWELIFPMFERVLRRRE